MLEFPFLFFKPLLLFVRHLLRFTNPQSVLRLHRIWQLVTPNRIIWLSISKKPLVAFYLCQNVQCLTKLHRHLFTYEFFITHHGLSRILSAKNMVFRSTKHPQLVADEQCDSMSAWVSVCSEKQSPGCGTLPTPTNEPMRLTISKLVVSWSVQASRGKKGKRWSQMTNAVSYRT